MGGPARNRRDT